MPASCLHVWARDFRKQSWQSILEFELLSYEMAHVKEWCCFMASALLCFLRQAMKIVTYGPSHFCFCSCLSAILTLDLEMSCGKSNTRKHIGEVGSGQDERHQGKWKSSKSLVLVLRSWSWWLIPITLCQKPSHVFWHIVSYGKRDTENVFEEGFSYCKCSQSSVKRHGCLPPLFI